MRWAHGDPNAVARAILAQPAFRRAPESTDVKPAPTFWEAIAQWVVDAVRWLFRPIATALGHATGVGTVIGVVLIGLALVAFVYLVFRLAVAFARPAFGRAADGSSERRLENEHTRADWLALARAAAANGDYAHAIAALFAAALAALDERAVVAFDPARTPGEYRRLVRRQARRASEPFDELTERFVRAAFAGRVAGRDDFDAAARAFASFEPLVGAP